MKRTAKNRGERGIALVVALFALLLLSAIGLAMMYSSNMETSINSNFRDKQSAAYASISGALEARDRLQPATGDIAAPGGIPSTSSANVIYIINPYGSETVAPWSASNKYADTELCQENLSSALGVTAGTVGVPCSGSSSLPSGSSWYTTKDDSSSGSYGTGFAAYKQSTPLTYKWTRITLKTDNMTPVGSAGNPGTGNQVCWDGKNQIALPSGSSSTCLPTGSVTSIDANCPIATCSYNSTPHISIAAPPSGGTQATAVANMIPGTSGTVSSATVTNAGSGYSTAPTVTLSGGGGTGAVVVANVVPTGAPVTSVSMTSAGTGCYKTAPGVSFSGGGGSVAATAHTTLESTTSCIYSWSATGSCSASGTQTVGASGGTGFSGSIDFKGNGSVKGTPSVITGGTGYTADPGGITGVSGCTLQLGWTRGYHVASIVLDSGGAGYTSAPTVNVSAPSVNTETTPTGTATIGSVPSNAGQISSFTIQSGGTGYTSAPTMTLSGGSGTGGAGILGISNNQQIGSISVTNGGSGYTTAPAVTISGGGGSGANPVSHISGGTFYGQVFLITSFAETPSGSKAITQMEVASSVRSFSVTGALTLDGPSPSFAPPSSQNFYVDGHDSNSCGESATPTKPAIGTFDNPNSPTSPTAQSNVINAINTQGKPSNYTGSNAAPDVENVYGALGDSMTTPTGMEDLANAIAGMTGANTYSANPGTINLGNSSSTVVDVVNGDLTLSGNSSGYGILLVRGNLTMSGNFSWHGPIFVIGTGNFSAANGGGNGQIVGTLFVAKTKDSSGNLLSALGSPTINFNGGGGNYIQYDHCWADNFYAKIPFVPPPPTTPLKILSTRTVTY